MHPGVQHADNHEDKPCHADPSTSAALTAPSKTEPPKLTGSTSPLHDAAASASNKMPCLQPLPAWRTAAGAVALGAAFQRNARYLELPCGRCTGCQLAHARAWALRCQLELQNHDQGVFSTLTYDDKHKPVTLSKTHLQLWLKRLRARLQRSKTARNVRFFAAGEYGETTRRPHYHAILYGVGLDDRDLLETTWGLGHLRTDPLNPQRIAYTAGYTQKKTGWHLLQREQRIDPETGECYTWQPPFIQMSRRPGIGHEAKKWPHLWRSYAINRQGNKIPVPRFLHEAWKQQATPDELEQLQQEKENTIRYITYHERQAHAQIIKDQQDIRSKTRHY